MIFTSAKRMNAKRFNLLLISAIFFTLLALWVHRFFPSKHFVIFEDISPYSYLYSTTLADGSPSAFWLDESKRTWRCNSAERPRDSLFVCSFIMELGEPGFGVDLSSYTHVLLDIQHQGSSKKLRFYARNFHPSYSNIEDPNSNKFNAINLDTADLNRALIVPLRELQVADWWLLQYNIPRANSKPDFRNTTEISVDFESNVATGYQDVEVRRIEFIGEWISSESWYLGILFIWLASILLYALNQLRLLRAQTNQDNKRIFHLAQQNKKLLQQSDELRRLSTVDPLTQCFNRFGVHQIISRLEANSRIEESTYSLILIDIDYFKRINDRRGHDAGDRVLQAASNIIQQRVRTVDYVGRWGGEEFVIILPNTRKEFALAIAEKIRLVIYDTVFESENPLNVTASFGIAQQEAGEDFASTFKRVDNALYAAKNQGRNCCVMLNE
jgi:diguanylate cyclase (GGDEF)-like protein